MDERSSVLEDVKESGTSQPTQSESHTVSYRRGSAR